MGYKNYLLYKNVIDFFNGKEHTVRDVYNELKIPASTAYHVVTSLVENGVLEQVGFTFSESREIHKTAKFRKKLN